MRGMIVPKHYQKENVENYADFVLILKASYFETTW